MHRPTRLFPLALLALASPALAEPTDVVVRVISQDAKFVGSSMGGAQVTLRDGMTGAVLAEGLTEGGTGDTALIMNSEGRSPMRATEDAAAFIATLDIDEPTLVNLQVHGPMGHEQSALYVSQQRWVMPGVDVNVGGGWVVELNGLVIEPEVSLEGGILAIKAQVSPMCGCPIAPGGQWPSEEYEVSASLWQDGKRIAAAGMDFVSAPGNFEGRISAPERGRFKLVLFAQNTRSGNSGYVAQVVEAASAMR